MSTTEVKFLAAAALLGFASSALAGVHYVDVNSTNATPPYTNWTTAATNIQDAVDAAVAGDEIVVTNGVYATGWRADAFYENNRVLVDKPLTLRSVNGAQFTTIDGGGYVRCVYLTNGASLSGFTLTNGFAHYSGGGAYGGTLNNCTLTSNRVEGAHSYYNFTYYYSDAYGGGASDCTLNNCTLTGNRVQAPFVYGNFYGNVDGGWAWGGGAYECILIDCTLTGNLAETPFLGSVPYDDNAPPYSGGSWGGGAYGCTLINCLLTNNSSQGYNGYGFPLVVISGLGGGASDCGLYNCTLDANWAVGGGGASYCDLYNCTLDANWADGAYGCTLNDCIVYFNNGANYAGGTLNYCCTTPQPSNGIGNITNAPLFVDLASGNLRLQPNSPCINAGNNSYVTSATDLDGNPRISGGIVDIGAYEYQWPQLAITPSAANVVLTWPTNNAGYDYAGFTLQFTRNLFPTAWSPVAQPAVTNAGQNSVTVPTAVGGKFFRLKSQ